MWRAITGLIGGIALGLALVKYWQGSRAAAPAPRPAPLPVNLAVWVNSKTPLIHRDSGCAFVPLGPKIPDHWRRYESLQQARADYPDVRVCRICEALA